MPGGTLRKRLQAVCLLIPLLAITQLAMAMPIHAQAQVAQVTLPTHIIGGFSANTTAQIANAAKDGVQTIFYYGNPPAKNSVFGRKLQSSHMKIIDGFISSNLYYYECQKARALKPAPLGLNSYCGLRPYPTFASNSAFLATIAKHLKQVQVNPLITGYWVLDDWPSWDVGGARQLLIQIHALIQRYTPSRPAICGFGASLAPSGASGWNDWLADNFSPQGCDAVGLYVYTAGQLTTTPLLSPAAYDWSMSSLLPAMFASLQRRGWNIAQEPLIGIVQAFGGPRAHTNLHTIVPTAANIATQSSSFCQHGAKGLTFYGWSDANFGRSTQTPMNSNIATGIKNGIAACTQYWNTHP